ncbi:hypothetical protein FB192DRAFT_1455501 [Mucor lusitanicus]|uniref:Anaphase-promoting complex subunit 6 n=1 Tax=Mucor circinelloides f. lusitanicus TaxID=29924 RepID=A0A8H4BNB8_MUCCL|nr:hypothetical protein FB192DRAFT_1455501 [Mucor lusitanicus]
MQPSRNTASPARRTAPLGIDTSHDLIRTPPAGPVSSSETEHLLSSPINFASRRSAGVGTEPGDTFLFRDQGDDDEEEARVALSQQHPLASDHISVSSTDSDPMPGTSGLSTSMLAPEQVSFAGNHLTREERLRVLRRNAVGAFLPGFATFINEKLTAATDSIRDVYTMALTHYQQKQYERAIETLHVHQVLKKSIQCRYLAALCSLALENGLNALSYLGAAAELPRADATHKDSNQGHLKLESAMCFARGRAFILLKDIYKARDWFKEALIVDVKCYDALEALVKYNMMEEKAEWEFVMTLPYEEHCGADSNYYRDLYRLKLKKRLLKGERTDADPKSLDVQLSVAQDYFSQSRYKECLEVCQEIKAQDSWFTEPIALHVSCLYELGMKNKLYEYAHELVKELKEEAVSWHAVGLYHLIIGKHLDAKRYFSHALSLNCFFEPSWHGYAYTLSLEKDHDKAIEAYTDCSSLILGYKEAREHLHTALKLANERQGRNSPIWEKIWCNLGHVYRQPPLQDYDRAIRCSENALQRNPKNADARTTLGIVYQLKGNAARAIAEYTEALKYTEAPELVTELYQSAIMTNFKTRYASRQDQPCLDGSFDIFAVANSIGVMEDEVATELEKDNRYNIVGDDAERHSFLFSTDDAMIVDQGDLQQSRQNQESVGVVLDEDVLE